MRLALFKRGISTVFAIGGLLCLLLSVPISATWGHKNHDHSATTKVEPTPQTSTHRVPPAQKYFTDVQLVNQHGTSMRIYSDVLKGKTVILNSFFTTCEASCPVTSGILEKVQNHLGDRLGKDVYIISLTLDPEHDTPEVVQRYASQFHAKDGWYFLTGPKQDVEFVLNKFGQYVAQKEAHSNILIVGNERTGLWKKAFALANPKALIPVIESVINDPGKPHS